MKTRYIIRSSIGKKTDGAHAWWALHTTVLPCHVWNTCFVVKRLPKISAALSISSLVYYVTLNTKREHRIPLTSFFSLSHVYHLPYCSHSLPFMTQIRGYIAGTPPPSSLRRMPSFFFREELSTFFPRRLALNCVYASFCFYEFLALSAVSFCTRKTKTIEGARTCGIDLSP